MELNLSSGINRTVVYNSDSVMPHLPLQHELQAGIACVFYIEQLVRHAQPQLKERRPKRRLLASLRPLSRVLTDLEVDLRTNPNDS